MDQYEFENVLEMESAKDEPIVGQQNNDDVIQQEIVFGSFLKMEVSWFLREVKMGIKTKVINLIVFKKRL